MSRRNLGRYRFREGTGRITDQAPGEWRNGRRLVARFEPHGGEFHVEEDDDEGELKVFRGGDAYGQKQPIAIFPGGRCKAALDKAGNGALMVFEVDPAHIPSTTELVTDDRLSDRGRLRALNALHQQHYAGGRSHG
jgi:hypothetical protein